MPVDSSDSSDSNSEPEDDLCNLAPQYFIDIFDPVVLCTNIILTDAVSDTQTETNRLCNSLMSNQDKLSKCCSINYMEILSITAKCMPNIPEKKSNTKQWTNYLSKYHQYISSKKYKMSLNVYSRHHVN